MGKIVRMTSKEIEKLPDLTDWERVKNFTEEEIERMAMEDPENPFKTEEDWADIRITRHRGAQKTPLKKPLAIRLTPDVVDYFKATGKGWQTRINDALKEWITAHPA